MYVNIGSIKCKENQQEKKVLSSCSYLDLFNIDIAWAFEMSRLILLRTNWYFGATIPPRSCINWASRVEKGIIWSSVQSNQISFIFLRVSSITISFLTVSFSGTYCSFSFFILIFIILQRQLHGIVGLKHYKEFLFPYFHL